MAAMLTLPLELAGQILETVMSEDSRAWEGRDSVNRWVIARGKDDDTGNDMLIIITEPLLVVASK